jgi:hypothetical protein
MKTCRTCKETKELNEFHIINGKHVNQCKPCAREYMRLQYRKKVPVPYAQKLYPEPGKKVCSKCREVKPVGCYGKKTNGAPQAMCRECSTIYQREYGRMRTRRELNKRWAAMHSQEKSA